MRIKLHLTVSKLLNRRRQIKVQCITQGASLKENLKFYIVVANKIWNFWNLFCKIICSKSDFSIQLTVALCSESDGFRHSWPRIYWTDVSSHHKRLWRFKIKNWQQQKKKPSHLALDIFFWIHRITDYSRQDEMMHLLTGFGAVLIRFTRDFSGLTPCLFSLKLVLYGKT